MTPQDRPTPGSASDRALELRAIVAGRQLPALDGLRGIYVFVVMAYHFGFPAPGSVGVTGFFVLSGFLITWLMLKEHRATGTLSVRRFYARRVLRIFPAYYAFVGLSIGAMALLDIPRTPGLLSSAFLYVMNYYNAFQNHPNGPFSHLWSLGVEEQFYLFWPIAFVLLAPRGARALATFLGIAIVVVVAWRSILFLRLGNVAYVYNAFDTRFDSIAIGCLLAMRVECSWFERVAASITRWAWLPLLTVGLLSASQMAPRPYRYAIGLTADSLLLAALMIQLLVLYRHWLWHWLQHPVVRYVGVISYPMYLYHQWGAAVGDKATVLPVIGQFAVAALATIAAASASYHFIERPFLSLKRRFEAPKARAPEPSQGLLGSSLPVAGR